MAYIGRALARLTTEVGALRDDMNVLTAIVVRMDSTLGRLDAAMAALLTETRAVRSQ